MKHYCIVYMSYGGMHWRYRCVAKTVSQAKSICKKQLGIKRKDIIEVYEERGF